MYPQTNTAFALDAADGVIDGKYFGVPVAPNLHSATPISASALALDAADGVIDGKFFGGQIMNQAPMSNPRVVPSVFSPGVQVMPTVGAFGTPAFVTPTPMVGAFGTPAFATPSSGYIQGGDYRSSLAMDAADGKIDGKFFGQQIL